MTIALVTGANKGIGLAVTRNLARRGIKVWLGARSEQRGRDAVELLRAEQLDTEFVLLDVTNPNSIAAAAERIASAGALDILVNNAGIMNDMVAGTLNPILPSQLPLNTVRELYDTNVFGAIEVIQRTLPLLRKSSGGRIVNVSSRFASFAHQTDVKWPPRSISTLGYSSAKAALNMVTVGFAYELRDTTIKINAVSPGTTATDLSGTDARKLAGKPGFGTPERGAETVVTYALLPAAGPSGRFFGPDGELSW